VLAVRPPPQRVIAQLALTEPGKFATIAYGLLPRDLFVKVENSLDPRLRALQNLDAEALAAIGGLPEAITAAKVEGDPGEIFKAIGENLPAWMATPVLEAE
jgi:hypothetical protein